MTFRNDFWNIIVEKKISLIHYDESSDSSISPEESRQFLIQPKAPVMDFTPKQKDESVEELYDMVE